MDFGAAHYVPVLKLKRGEKQALASLHKSILSGLTPLFEVVEKKPEDTLEAHLHRAFKDLDSAVKGCAPYFLDLVELEQDGASAARRAFVEASKQGTPYVPVTGMSRTHDVSAALGAARSGVAIRLTRVELESGSLPGSLLTFLKHHKLGPREVDLLVDIGPVDQMVPSGVEQMIRLFLPLVPKPLEWRTLTLLSCAFPKSMAVAASEPRRDSQRLG